MGPDKPRRATLLQDVPMFEAFRFTATSQVLGFILFPHAKKAKSDATTAEVDEKTALANAKQAKLDERTLTLFLDRYYYPALRTAVSKAECNIPPNRAVAASLAESKRKGKGAKRPAPWHIDLPLECLPRFIAEINQRIQLDVGRYDNAREGNVSASADEDSVTSLGLYHAYRNVQFFVRAINTKLLSRGATFEASRMSLSTTLPFDIDLLAEHCSAGLADQHIDVGVEVSAREPNMKNRQDVPLSTFCHKGGHLPCFGWLAGLQLGKHKLVKAEKKARPGEDLAQDDGEPVYHDNGLPFQSFYSGQGQYQVAALNDVCNIAVEVCKSSQKATGQSRCFLACS